MTVKPSSKSKSKMRRGLSKVRSMNGNHCQHFLQCHGKRDMKVQVKVKIIQLRPKILKCKMKINNPKAILKQNKIPPNLLLNLMERIKQLNLKKTLIKTLTQTKLPQSSPLLNQ
jgi:hypothetical protein